MPTAPERPVPANRRVDRVALCDEATSTHVAAPEDCIRLVKRGRHDILNDPSHRSVAGTMLLYLESPGDSSQPPTVLVPAETLAAVGA